MTSLVRTVPKLVFRTTRRVSRLPLPVLAGAAALIYRKTRRSEQPPVVRASTSPTAPTTAVDLDAEVTLPSELPIRGYDAMNAADASRAIRDLTAIDDVLIVLSFEEENAKRSTVLTAARAHLTVLEQGARR